MTQIAILLVVATAFTWLMVCNVYILQSKRGAYTRDKTTYHGSLNVQGAGLFARGAQSRGNKISIVYKFHQMNYKQCSIDQ